MLSEYQCTSKYNPQRIVLLRSRRRRRRRGRETTESEEKKDHGRDIRREANRRAVLKGWERGRQRKREREKERAERGRLDFYRIRHGQTTGSPCTGWSVHFRSLPTINNTPLDILDSRSVGVVSTANRLSVCIKRKRGSKGKVCKRARAHTHTRTHAWKRATVYATLRERVEVHRGGESDSASLQWSLLSVVPARLMYHLLPMEQQRYSSHSRLLTSVLKSGAIWGKKESEVLRSTLLLFGIIFISGNTLARDAFWFSLNNLFSFFSRYKFTFLL